MTNNSTASEQDSLVTGIVDFVSANLELTALAAIVVAGCGLYAYFHLPLVQVFLNKFLKKYDDEILAVIDANLTKVQKKAYLKLSEETQKRVNNTVLRNVILTAWDHNDDKVVALVKGEVRNALKENK